MCLGALKWAGFADLLQEPLAGGFLEAEEGDARGGLFGARRVARCFFFPDLCYSWPYESDVSAYERFSQVAWRLRADPCLDRAGNGMGAVAGDTTADGADLSAFTFDYCLMPVVCAIRRRVCGNHFRFFSDKPLFHSSSR